MLILSLWSLGASRDEAEHAARLRAESEGYQVVGLKMIWRHDKLPSLWRVVLRGIELQPPEPSAAAPPPPSKTARLTTAGAHKRPPSTRLAA